MKRLEDLQEIIESHKQILREKYNVQRIAVFGSYARSEQDETSDIDLLVEFSHPIGLLFIHLADYLEEILGEEVDLLTPDAIKPNRREYIMKDLVYV